MQRRTASAFPFGTLAVNVLGSLVLGVLHGAGVTGDAMLLAGTALLGSFTTFSAWMAETESLRERGESGLAARQRASSASRSASRPSPWAGRSAPVL